MSRKKFLTRAVVVLLLGGFASVIFVFGASMNPSAKARAVLVKIDVSNMQPGDVKVTSTDLPIAVVAQSSQILADLAQLDAHVWNPQISTEYTSNDGKRFFIFVPLSARAGQRCLVKHVDKSEPNPGRRADNTWLGGFWDPCWDASFDYAGRAIKNPQYSYLNVAPEAASLGVVPAVKEKDGVLTLNLFQR